MASAQKRAGGAIAAVAAAALATGCSGATDAECREAFARTSEVTFAKSAPLTAGSDPEARRARLADAYVEGCTASRRKGFGACVVEAPDARARMDCSVRFAR
jgi:hypothetical protein